MVSKEQRKDAFKGGDFRVTNGDLKTVEYYDKYEGRINISSITEADRATLETEYNLHRAFYFFPDINNYPTTYFQVKWTGKWAYNPDKFKSRYSLVINLKEV